MAHPELILLVRFASELTLAEASRVIDERAPEFAALSGLTQKYYLRETESGDFAGLYLWESTGAMREYQESELRTTIGEAYRVIGTPQIEVFQVIRPLRETPEPG